MKIYLSGSTTTSVLGNFPPFPLSLFDLSLPELLEPPFPSKLAKALS